MRLAAILVLILAKAAVAQPPSDAQLIVRPKLDDKDLQRLSRQLLGLDVQSGMIRKWMDQAKNDPEGFLKEMGSIPPGLLPAGVREQLAQMPKLPQPVPTTPPAIPPISSENANSQLAPPPITEPMPRRPNTQPEPRPRTPTAAPPTSRLDPRLQNNPSVQNLIKIWEKNFGSIDRTPALKKAISDLLNSSVGNDSPTGSGLMGDGGLGSLLNPETTAGKEVADLLDSVANGSSFNFSSLGVGDWKFSLPDVSGSGGRVGSPPSFSASSGENAGSITLVILFIAVAGFLIYRFRSLRLQRGTTAPAALLSRLNPALLNDRESLVRVFEEITLDTIGGEARTWNHRTIAAAWARRFGLPMNEANQAAGWYEIARYTPVSDALPDDVIPQARLWYTRIREANPG